MPRRQNGTWKFWSAVGQDGDAGRRAGTRARYPELLAVVHHRFELIRELQTCRPGHGHLCDLAGSGLDLHERVGAADGSPDVFFLRWREKRQKAPSVRDLVKEMFQQFEAGPPESS